MGRSTDTSPASKAVAVTPHDTDNITGGPCRSLYVGTSGDITAVLADGGSAVLFANVPVGILPIQVTRVNDTGTDADDIVALF